MTKHRLHYFLISLIAVSLLFVLQIDLGIIPLLPINLDREKCDRINRLISNLSEGFILSYVFYLMIVYFPEKSKEVTIRKLIEPRLSTIVNMIQESIWYIVTKYEINYSERGFKNLTEADFDRVVKLENKAMNFKYKRRYNKKRNWENYSTGEVLEIDHFLHERKIVVEKIDQIFLLPTIAYENDCLIENLAKLRDSRFYYGPEAFKKDPEATFINFNKGVFEYYKHYLALIRYQTTK